MKMWKVGMLAVAMMLSSCTFTCDSAFVDDYNLFRSDILSALLRDTEDALETARERVFDYKEAYGGEVCLADQGGETVEIDASAKADEFLALIEEALADL